LIVVTFERVCRAVFSSSDPLARLETHTSYQHSNTGKLVLFTYWRIKRLWGNVATREANSEMPSDDSAENKLGETVHMSGYLICNLV
jgi:hypothetical protein